LQKLQQLLNRPDVDIWFADKSGFEGDQRPRKSWDKKGRRTRVTRNSGHLRMNIKKLLERLDQAILDVIDSPKKIQQTTAIATLF